MLSQHLLGLETYIQTRGVPQGPFASVMKYSVVLSGLCADSIFELRQFGIDSRGKKPRGALDFCHDQDFLLEPCSVCCSVL